MKMSYFHLIIFLLGTGLSTMSWGQEDLIQAKHSSQVRASQKMNFLFIAVDDLKPLMACYGDSLAHTPNIDAIARKGITFTNNHCQQAVCAPSRVSLLTSRYPDQTRVWDLETLMREMSPGIVSLPQYLIQQGYQTAATGKIFDYRSVDNGRDTPSWSIPWRHSWDASYYSPITGKPSYYYASQHAKDTIALLKAEALQLGVDQQSYVQARYFPAFENADVPVDAYVDGALAKIGIELLEQVSGSDKPFFLGIGFQRPHLPFNAPKQFWDLYDRNDFHLSAFQGKAFGSPDIAYHNNGELRSYTGIPGSGNVPDQTQLELIHGYYAATSYIDFCIGQVMDKLKELGLENNTAIVLWGDHGWHLGDHQLWCKHSNFEQATRSPLIISYPGQANQGAQCASPTEFTDIAPTLCSLADVPLPAYFEGETLLPLFMDTLSFIREASLSQYPRNNRMGYSLRTSRYRYTRWTDPDGSLYASELYDYQLDPLETINYANDSDYKEIKDRLDSLTVERINIPSTQKRIRFRAFGLVRSTDTITLEGAKFHLAQEIQETDIDGNALFTHHPGMTYYQVDAEGYLPMIDSLPLSNDTLLLIYLQEEEPTFNVSLSVIDSHSGSGLMSAEISLNGMVYQTDLDGMLSLISEAGSYQFTINKENYQGLTDTLTINGDTSLLYKLDATHSDIKIWLKEGTSPVNLATVSLDGKQIVSNSLGISRFETIATGLSYEYMVEKPGFRDRNGTVFLLSDTTVHIQMERVTGIEINEFSEGLTIWPNPAGVFLHCRLNKALPDGWIRICDIYGRSVYRQPLEGIQFSVPLDNLKPGIYWICTISDGSLPPVRFIKY